MSIYRCNGCATIVELADAVHGSKLACAKCQAPVTVYDTRFFVKGLIDRFLVLRRELDALKAEETETEAQAPATGPVAAEQALDAEDLHNTAALATEAQHQPIVDWLTSRQIRARCDVTAVDTTGFFDEAAESIVQHHALLAPILEQLRFGYRREWSWLNVDVSQRSPAERKALNQLLRQLYSYSLFTRHHFNKQKMSIGVGIQTASHARRFFDGAWLEWWTMMSLLSACRERQLTFAIARNVQLEFQNDDQRELDVVLLLNKRFPIVVECKTGEFRQDIDRCVSLRKRLGLDSSQYIVCVADLAQEEARSLSAMVGLTFTNLTGFAQHSALLLGK